MAAQLLNNIQSETFDYLQNNITNCDYLPQLVTNNFKSSETQVDSKQDMVRIGNLNDGTKWIAVADGHGGDKVINCLRIADWNDIMSEENPEDIIYPLIESLGNTSGTGATLSLVKINKNCIKCWWIGDSTIQIYEDNKKIFHSIEHNIYNPDEVERMNSMNIKKETQKKMEVLSETNITMTTMEFFHFGSKFNNRDTINMSNSLGHNQLTGKFIQKECITIEKGKLYNIIVASDGLWDMILPSDEEYIGQYNAEELSELALKRWNQEWLFISKSGKEIPNQKIPCGDDVGIATWNGYVF